MSTRQPWLTYVVHSQSGRPNQTRDDEARVVVPTSVERQGRTPDLGLRLSIAQMGALGKPRVRIAHRITERRQLSSYFYNHIVAQQGLQRPPRVLSLVVQRHAVSGLP